MSKNSELNNAYEALCELAFKESWCWHYPCSTCANMHFRYAFIELAEGRHPHSQEWQLSRSQSLKQFGESPQYFHQNIKDNVLKLCLDSNISNIQKVCVVPEWLGYLGLVMTYMRSSSAQYSQLSKHWAQQLKSIMPDRGDVHRLLEEVLLEERELDFTVLEACENALIGIDEQTKQDEVTVSRRPQSLYRALVDIVENPGKPYSTDIALYARQKDIDRLSDEQYRKLCEMYQYLSEEARSPWAGFKKKFLNGR